MVTVSERIVSIGVSGNPGDLNAIVDKLKFKHPHARRILSHALYRNTDGEQGWDGYIRPLKKTDPDHAEALRGYKRQIMAAIEECRIEVNPASRIIESPFAHVTSADIPDDIIKSSFPLDENQRAIIAAWLQNGMGIGKIAVNGGKTAAFAGFAAMLKSLDEDVRLLYITDRERLVTQVSGEMRKFLPGFHVTKFGGGDSDESGKDMVVCTLAMLRTHIADLREVGWFNTFHAIMFDECHHAASETAEAILQEFKGAFFRIAASDTIKFDDPLKHDKIVGLCGPVLLTVHQDTLIEAGRSAVPHIYLIDPPTWKDIHESVPYRPEVDSKAWVLLDGEETMRRGRYIGPVYERDDKGEIKMKKSKVLNGTKIESVDVPVTKPGLHTVEIDSIDYEVDSSYCLLERSVDKCIVNFKERNGIICEWVKHFAADQGKRTLVVATRTVHVLILEAALTNCEGIDPEKVMTLVGEDSPARRNKVFAWFKRTPGAILISPLVKEGVSINEIEAGVVADYVGDWEYANQIIGRFLRKKEADNSVEIAWFIDRQQRRFEKGCLNMFKRLQEIKGYLYYWPVVLPSDIEKVDPSDTTAILEEAKERLQTRLKL
ncbi:MAG: DEAD/DEAH box helicase [Azonexus sp.]